ncbi:class I SAM-dependent methyltransferase [Listeria monocytogenes]|nr:class I SAM-dependent methyltransferase [Listeria monocytogenes]
MWEDIYRNEIDKVGSIQRYFDIRIQHKKSFLNTLRKYITPTSKIIEAGCGTGCVTIQLAQETQSEVIGIDVDTNMLKLANEISNEINLSKSPKFMEHSLFSLNEYWGDEYFDLCYNRGVLEHFSDEKIIEGINQMLTISKTVVISLPTQYFSSNEGTGDERYLSVEEWNNLIKSANGEIVEYYYHHRESVLKRILNYKKYFKPKPYLVIVIKKSKV